MQFIDLRAQFERIESDVRSRIDAVLCDQKFIMGPSVIELEERLARYVGVDHALSCSSGTDALVIPLMAFDLKKGDAVFVPSFTFFASAESITLAGGTPVFVDSDPLTFNLSPTDLQRAIEKTLAEGILRPRGIMTVDLFGLPADYDRIEDIAQAYDLFIIEDAAQGFGGSYHEQKVGSFGVVAATSFFPAKPLGCYGDGGAIFTNNEELADLIRSIRVHGQGTDRYDNVRIGLNGRLDSIQAAVLLSKLEIFDDEIVARNRVAHTYTHALKDILVTPQPSDGFTSAWAQYTLLAKDETERAAILGALKDKDIPTAIYYPTPIHLSTAYASLGYQRGDLSVCEALSKRAFSLPMHPYLKNEEIDAITQTIRECLTSAS
jgi:dTDP-4-amino-4,6-dideoxygalactose transaminase